jgi:hypothetical protein
MPEEATRYRNTGVASDYCSALSAAVLLEFAFPELTDVMGMVQLATTPR